MVDVPRGRRKRSPINLHAREFIYTLPSGEVVVIAPHKKGRGLVELPEGTTVKVIKLDAEGQKSQNN